MSRTPREVSPQAYRRAVSITRLAIITGVVAAGAALIRAAMAAASRLCGGTDHE